MHEQEEAKIITAWLNKQSTKPPGYPSGPLFRLSWSTDQYEMRRGTFCLYSGTTLIREVEGTERVRKYPFFHDRWIFEQWYPPELVNCADLPEAAAGSYEPLYMFENIKGESLALNIKVIQFLVSRIVNKPKSSPALIRSTILADMYQKEEDQLEFDMEYLEVSTAVQSNLHFGEGIIVPSNYTVLSPNLRNKKE